VRRAELHLRLPPGGWTGVIDTVSGEVRVKASDVELFEQ
jgi:hypothetical protein